ncbi:hypothetical protein F5884DRAFT_863223 [Xylogone sp. PMI_703]|nr:hypothetical protein F5884DRAFT_863223 [Xylogone sp. PMI_703]
MSGYYTHIRVLTVVLFGLISALTERGIDSTCFVDFDHQLHDHSGLSASVSLNASYTNPDATKKCYGRKLNQSLHGLAKVMSQAAVAIGLEKGSKFTKLVLHARGIFIDDTNSIVPSAFSHFGTSEPLEGKTIDYKGIAGLSRVNIWAMFDGDPVKDIATEYREMR